MAAMDMRRARALAEQMIRSGQNKGKSLEDLVRQIVVESEGAPDTAIGNALVVVPQRLTPATPAPMQTGIPMFAPKPTTEMLPTQMAQMAAQPQEQELPVAPQRASKYAPMLTGLERQIVAMEAKMADAAKNKQPISPVDKATLAGLRQAANQVSEMKAADESASLPQELQETFANREARIARREELLAEDKARSPFQALLAAGAAGAQGRRGETDIEAITRILQAGFGGYDQSRRGFEEGTENIAEARDQAMIDRYNMQERAREAALARARDIQGIGEKAEDRAVRDVRLPQELRTGEAQAALAEFKAKVAPEEFATEQDVRRAQAANYREISGGGRGGAKVDVEARADRDELDDAAADYESARTIYNEALRENNMKASMVPAEVKSAFLASKAKLEQRSRSFARRYGASPYIGGQAQGAAPTRTAIAAPTGGAGWSATKF